jgi:hypothetical protein
MSDHDDDRRRRARPLRRRALLSAFGLLVGGGGGFGALIRPGAATAGALLPLAEAPGVTGAAEGADGAAIEEVRGGFRGVRRLRVPRSRGGAGLGRRRHPRNPMTDFRFPQRSDRF